MGVRFDPLDRMALQTPKRVEFEHEGGLFIGWHLTEPDELMVTNEGLEMVRAIEIRAQTNFIARRLRMLRATTGKL